MDEHYAESARAHVCGWRGPWWLHLRQLCGTCNGHYPTLEGHAQVYGPVCSVCWPEQSDGDKHPPGPVGEAVPTGSPPAPEATPLDGTTKP